MNRITLTANPSKDYELLDSGGEEKLERFGSVFLARPDPQALWEKTLPEGEWAKAQGRFERKGKEGVWHATDLPKEWQIEFGGLNFLIKPTTFKHTGLFPEQLSNWEWSQSLIEKAKGQGREVNILNVFGYTGGATIAAAKAGAKVTHVDASKTAVAWARQNAALSGLKDAPVRWMVEDAMKFIKREVSRGTKYDGIVMDPPAFGHGPKDELWKIEEDFIELVKLCRQLLNDQPVSTRGESTRGGPLFFLINGYAAGYSPLAFAYNLETLEEEFGGGIEYGDITIAQKDGRLLPAGIFARWSK